MASRKTCSMELVWTLCLSVLVYFVIGWQVSMRSQKLAWVDFFWSSSFLLIGVIFLAFRFQDTPASTSPAAPEIFLGLLTLMALWSFRLSFYLFRRLFGGKEDPRYLGLKLDWQENLSRNVLGLYLFQAVLALLLSSPLWITFFSPGQNWGPLQMLAGGTFVIGWFGESMADRQLARFKSENQGQKKVCERGLWRYSRHPNYFFEMVIWLSYAIYCMGLENGGWAWLSFFIMTFLLVKVTGVAPSERQALATKGDLYRDYQRRTSVLIPWPPKELPKNENSPQVKKT